MKLKFGVPCFSVAGLTAVLALVVSLPACSSPEEPLPGAGAASVSGGAAGSGAIGGAAASGGGGVAGSSAGRSETGGVDASGGNLSGGNASGGNASGGNASGGNASGGNASGGNASGGNAGSQGGASGGGGIGGQAGGSGGAAAGSAGQNAGAGGASAGAAGQAGDGATTGGEAAMVVRMGGMPTAGDDVMLDVMRERGLEVSIFADNTVQAEEVSSMRVVVISSSAESGRLQERLRTLPVPILCVEDGQYGNQGMATASGKFNTNMLDIAPDATELVGPLSGTVTIASMSASEAGGWATPAETALIGATVAGNTDQVVVFAYPSGVQMAGLTAPAKRAGYAIREPLAANLNDDGKQLFDAVLGWLLLP